MQSPDNKLGTTVQPHLGVWDVAAITAGIIIGSGIYRSPPDIAKLVNGPSALLGLWVVGGIIAMVGALCYAELAAAYPQQGGTYVYLNRAFGRWCGFLYAWCEFWIVRPGNVGAMAFIFVDYAGAFVPELDSPLRKVTVACAVVFALGSINLLGVRVGKRTQLALSLAKVLGLLLIFAVGMWRPGVSDWGPAVPIAIGSISLDRWLLAMVFVLFAYGGWNETAAVTAEVRDPQRNMLRGLLLGTAIVIGVYLLANLAFLRSLGFDGVAQSEAVAADLMSGALGYAGRLVISASVCISCLGAINGMLFTGSRLYYALGVEHRTFGWLGHWNERLGTPVRALVLQTAISIALIIIFGLSSNAFELLVLFTVPVFWSFLLLVSIAVVVLRVSDGKTPRPFRLPLFPLEPAIFFTASLLMIYSGVNYLLTKERALSFQVSAGWMLLVLVSGLLVYFLSRDQAPAGSAEDKV
ncbi:MAG TPA: amino acid permease [Pirellulaceae bacterium]|nr:amino acid permease [Pirellulaceae bacterium]